MFTTYALIIYSPEMASLAFRIIVEFFPGIGLPLGRVAGTILEATLSVLQVGFVIYALGCSPLFPAAAYGHPMTWPQARQLLSGNFWRLIACCMLVAPLAFLTSLPVIIILMVPIPPLGAFGQFAMTGIVTIFRLIFVALFASILCRFYQRLVLARENLLGSAI
jgi:hypothetical protein